MEEAWRRRGGGLEEMWRRCRGGVEEVWRRWHRSGALWLDCDIFTRTHIDAYVR
jgi:hypothetical protein